MIAQDSGGGGTVITWSGDYYGPASEALTTPTDTQIGQVTPNLTMPYSTSPSWQIVGKASNKAELQSLTPTISDIPNGAPVRISIDLPWYLPFGWVANTAGMEWFGQKLAKGITVTDVYSTGIYNITIEGTAVGLLWVVLVPLLIIVLAALAAFGVQEWKTVQVEAQLTQQQQAGYNFVQNQTAAGESSATATQQALQIQQGAAQAAASAAASSNPLSGIAKDLGIGAGTAVLLILGFILFTGRHP